MSSIELAKWDKTAKLYKAAAVDSKRFSKICAAAFVVSFVAFAASPAMMVFGGVTNLVLVASGGMSLLTLICWQTSKRAFIQNDVMATEIESEVNRSITPVTRSHAKKIVHGKTIAARRGNYPEISPILVRRLEISDPKVAALVNRELDSAKTAFYSRWNSR